jgi:formylglycine-generating enzyme required for sulfatase activity
MTVNSTATSGISAIAASGVGEGTRLAAASGNLTFGNLPAGQFAVRTMQVANTGTGNLTVDRIVFPQGFSGAPSGNFVVGPGSSRSIDVYFAPFKAAAFSSEIQVLSNDSRGAVVTLPVYGAGYSKIPGLVAHYPFDGNSTADVSGSGPNATLTNGATLVSGGYTGGAVSCPDGNKVLSLDAPVLPANSSNYTIAAWIRFPIPSVNDWRTFAWGAGSRHHVIVDGAGNLGVYNDGFFSSGLNIITIAAGWHHITAVAAGGETKFHVDGDLKGSAGAVVPVPITRIGNNGGGQPFGTFDEVRIYDRGLAASEVVALYDEYAAPAAPPGLEGSAVRVVNVGEAFSFSLNATNAPRSFSIENPTEIPSWISLNATTGVLSGTAFSAGNFSVNITATNSMGTSRTTLVIRGVMALPVVTAPATVFAFTGVPFSYRIPATYLPTSYGTAGLPGWLTLNATTGELSGTPPASGNFTLSLNATNSVGTGNSTLGVSILTPLREVPTIHHKDLWGYYYSHMDQTYVDGVWFSAPIPAFRLAAVETTLGEWRSVREWANTNGYDLVEGEGSAPSHPVRGVNFLDAVKWCNARSEREGLQPVYSTNSQVYRTGQPRPDAIGVNISANGYRLPTRVESWRASKGGANESSTYSGGSDANPVAVHSGNSPGAIPSILDGRGTRSVGSKAPNSLGIFDLTGNVGEWIWDFIIGPDAARDTGKVWGGNWNASPVATSLDGYYIPSAPVLERSLATGFRVARNSAQIVFQGPLSLNAPLGSPLSLAVNATNQPTAYSANATLLPPGISLHATTGVFSGTPTAAGTFNATITASNADSTATANFTFSIKEPMVLVRGVNPTWDNLAGAKVAGFEIARTEVRWDEWQRIREWAMDGNRTYSFAAGNGSAADNPVRNVNWHDAAKWCNAKSEMEGLLPAYLLNGSTYTSGEAVPTLDPLANGYRLPTAAEWDWAARGGLSSLGYTYSGSNDYNSVGWIRSNSDAATVKLDNLYNTGTSNFPNWVRGGTLPVGTKAANELGIHDMTGNVWELIQEPGQVRGSSYLDPDPLLTNAGTADAAARQNNIGFRPARNARLPFLSANLSATGMEGYPLQFALLVPAENPASIAISGLPGGLSYNATTGFVSGTPSVNGTFTANITASNDAGHFSTRLRFVVAAQPPPPAINGPLSATSTAGSGFRYTVNATTWNSTAAYSASGLPAGLSINATTGTISGIPTAPGNFSITLAVANQNLQQNATATLSVSFLDPFADVAGGSRYGMRVPPFRIARTEVTGADWDEVRAWALKNGYSIGNATATGPLHPAASVSWSNAARWCNARSERDRLDPVYKVNGAVFRTGSTTPSADPAANGYRLPSEAEWTWAVRGGLQGGNFTYSGSNTLDAVAWFAANSGGQSRPVATKAPNELGLHDLNGNVWELVSQADSMGGGWSTLQDSLFIAAKTGVSIHPAIGFRLARNSELPWITSSLSVNATRGVPFVYTVGGRNFETSNATGLPAGLAFDAATHRITGTPTARGTTNATVRVSNSQSANNTETLSIRVVEPVPVFSSFPSSLEVQLPAATVNQTFTATNAVSYNATGLPAGLTINSTTGSLSGNATTAGSYPITVQASNADHSVSAGLVLVVQPAGPLITSAATANGTAGLDFSATVTASGGTPTYSASGLPTGLSINSTTGAITGTPAFPGNYSVAISATTANGSATGTLRLNLRDELAFVQGGTLPPASGLSGNAVAGFRIGTAEVTWGRWQDVRAWAVANGYPDLANTGNGTAANHPVRNVNWFEVVKWCNARSEREGLVPVYLNGNATYKTGNLTTAALRGGANGYRLPTEAEWDFAARGGLLTQNFTYSGGNNPADVAWTFDNSPGLLIYNSTFNKWVGTQAVATKLANELGIHDMSGNVWEWCWDPINGGRRLRGGGFNFFADGWSKLSYRGGGTVDITSWPHDWKDTMVGFRVARGISELVPVEGGSMDLRNSANATTVPNFQIGRTEVAWDEWKHVADWAAANGYSDLGNVTVGIGNLPVRKAYPPSLDTTGFSDIEKYSQQNTVQQQNLMAWCNAKSQMEGLTPVYFFTNNSTVFKSGTLLTYSNGNYTDTGWDKISGYMDYSIQPNANGYRLPLQTEWLWAYRGGLLTRNFTYSGSGTVNDVAWTVGNSLDQTRPVASKLPNELGIHDLDGNVREFLCPMRGMYTWAKNTWADSDLNFDSVNPPLNSPGWSPGFAGFRLVRNLTLAFTGGSSFNATLGQPFTGNLSANASGVAFSARSLPAGLTLNSTTGAISGTPTFEGAHTVVVAAVKNSERIAREVTITVIGQDTPVITSNLTAAAKQGQAFQYQITAANSPTSFKATGLPAGLSINATTGLISGTPLTAGTFPVALEASNAKKATATLNLVVASGAPDFSVPGGTFHGAFGYSFSRNVTAASAATYGAQGLPIGLEIDPQTGVISGIPTQSGNLSAVLEATNEFGTKSADVVFAIAPKPAPPVVANTAPQAANANVATSYTINATNNPTRYSTSALPEGLLLDPATGTISGTPASPGSYPVTLFATNPGGTGNATVTFNFGSLVPLPAFTGNLAATAHQEIPFNLTLNATNGDTVPLVFGNSTALPAGLTLNSTTGAISGTPSGPGNFTVRVTAANRAGTTSANLTLSILSAFVEVPAGNNTAAFRIGRLELSGAQWDAVRSWAVSRGYTDLPQSGQVNRPARNVSWNDAIKWCNARSEMEGLVPAYRKQDGSVWKTGGIAFRQTSVFESYFVEGFVALPGANGYRLPDHREWFWAARGASTTSNFTYSGGNTMADVAWFNVDLNTTEGRAQPGGLKLPNALGIFDMSGNVREWVTKNGSFPDGGSLGGALNGSGETLAQGEQRTFSAGTPESRDTYGGLRLALPSAAAAPAFAANISASVTVGQPISFAVPVSNSNNLTATTALPAGLSLNASTGLVTGTASQVGNFTVNLTASNTAGTTPGSLVLRVLPLTPVFTGASFSATAYRGANFTHMINASNSPTTYAATGLPGNLTLNATTGVVSGTIPGDVDAPPGTATANISASNGATGSGSLVFTILGRPVVSDPPASTTTVGTAFSYQIQATNNAAGFGNSTALPSWLSLNSTTGLLSGTAPAAIGNFSVNVTATNPAGTSIPKQVRIQVLPVAPAFTSNATTIGYAGQPFAHTLAATNNQAVSLQPLAFGNSTALPSWLSLNSTTGLLSGNAVAGNYTFGTTASNGATTAGTLSITIFDKPAITSPASVSSHTAFAYQITATNNPTAFSATGLPAGVTLNATIGLLSGMTAPGNFTFTVSASNPAGSGNATVNLSVSSGFVEVQNGTLRSSNSLNGTQVGRFQISKFETTWAEWASVRSWAVANSYDFSDNATTTAQNAALYPLAPANNITWYDAVKWCNARSVREGLQPVYKYNGATFKTGTGNPNITTGEPVPDPAANGYRLPAEAEWEWAARGGVLSQNHTFSGGNSANEVSWNFSNSSFYGPRSPVGNKTPNELGLHDMSGGVAEWCFDPYSNTSSESHLYRRERGGHYRSGESIAIWPDAPWQSELLRVDNRNDMLGKKLGGISSLTFGSRSLQDHRGFRPARNTAASVPTGDPAPAIGYATKPVSFQLASTNSPTAYSATGLPLGLSISSTGLITGNASTAGNFTANITISNAAFGNATTQILLLILPLPPAPVITSENRTGFTGMFLSHQINATNSPTAYSATGLPGGLSLNATTGLIAGTPSAAGNFTVSLSATNPSATANSTTVFAIKDRPLVSVSTANSTILDPFSIGKYEVTRAEWNHVKTYSPSYDFDEALQARPLVFSPNGSSIPGWPKVVITPESTPGRDPFALGHATTNSTVSRNFTVTNLSGQSLSFSFSSNGWPEKSVFSQPAIGVSINSGTNSDTAAINTVHNSSFTLTVRFRPPYADPAWYRAKIQVIARDSNNAVSVNQTLTFLGQGTGGQPNTADASDHPMHSLSYSDAAKYCNALSELNGLTPVYKWPALNSAINKLLLRNGEGISSATRSVYRSGLWNGESHVTGSADPVPDLVHANGYRLPTREEWEWAMRGGNSSSTTYSGSNNATEVAWHRDNSTGSTLPLFNTLAGGSGLLVDGDLLSPSLRVAAAGTFPVGQKLPNPLGIFDLHGNVAELFQGANGTAATQALGGAWDSEASALNSLRSIHQTIDDIGARGTGLRLVRSGPPVIRSIAYTANGTTAASASGQVGVAFTPVRPIAKNVRSYAATGLPEGLTINATTGHISGTPSNSGFSGLTRNFTANITVENASGTSSAFPFPISIKPAAPVLSLPSTPRDYILDSAQTYTPPASNSPTLYTATGLPPGLTINATTGLISGTPTSSGTFSVILTVQNDGGSATGTLPLKVWKKPSAFNQPEFTFWNIQPVPWMKGFERLSITADTDATHSASLVSGNIGATINSTATSSAVIEAIPALRFQGANATYRATATNPAGNHTANFTIFVEDGGFTPFQPSTQSISGTAYNTRLKTFLQEFYLTQSADLLERMVMGIGGSLFGGSSSPPPATVPAFLIAHTEVTVGEWLEVTNNSTSYQFGNATSYGGTNWESRPIVGMSWFDALKFCNAKSERVGLTPAYTLNGTIYRQGYPAGNRTDSVSLNTTANGYRLPTAAEWLCAGTKNGQISNNPFPVSNNATLNTATYNATLAMEAPEHTVRSGQANANGIFDMAGSVWEWIWDSQYYDNTLGANTHYPALMGGSYKTPPATNKLDTFINVKAKFTASGGGYLDAGFRTVRNFPAPRIVSRSAATGRAGQPFSHQIAAANSNGPLAGWTTYNATGLPPSLTLNATSGLITGTPSSAGNFTANLTATNPGGNATATLSITIAP